MATKKPIEEQVDEKAAEDAIEEAVEQVETGEAVATSTDTEDSVEKAASDTEVEAVKTKTTKAGKHSAKAIREAEAEEARKAAAASAKTVEEVPAPKAKVRRPNPLKSHGKAYRAAAEQVDRTKFYELDETLKLVKSTAKTKFDPSVELHINLGVDPRQADQMVRDTVVLPAGTGKTLRIAVVAPADKQADAKKAGASIVGDASLIAKIEKGKLDFDVLIATPDMMPALGKVAKVLGPRGLMPNPKSGTVTGNVVQAIEQANAGKVEFRIDKQAIVHMVVGKASFTPEQLTNNVKTAVDAIMKAKPASTKGTYVKAVSMATTMGPGIKMDVQKIIALANPKK